VQKPQNLVLAMQEEEDAAAAANNAKQARRKARKKAAKSAPPPVDSPQQPSLADGSRQEAAAAEQSVDEDAAPDGEHQRDVQSSLHPDAVAAAPTDAGIETDNSWQLCPLSKVGNRSRGAMCGNRAFVVQSVHSQTLR
jgi:hypothetical protein